MRLALAFLLASASALSALDTVSVSMVPGTAYEQGTVPAIFRLSRGGSTSGALTVDVTVSGTAAVGADYDIHGVVGGRVTIPDGASSVDVTVNPVDDGLIEMRQSVILTISPSAADDYLRGSVFSATMLIADNDLRLTWVPIKTDAAELLDSTSPPEAAVRLQFNAMPTTPVIVQFKLMDGTGAATLKTDYRMTYMPRSITRSPSESILDNRSVFLGTGMDYTVGCKVAVNATKGSSSITVNNAAKLEEDDWIQIGSSEVIYTVAAVDHVTNIVTLNAPLEEAAAKDVVVRNNLESATVTNGGIQGIGLSGNEDCIDLAITPLYDNVAEGAETVTLRMLASPDYFIVSPTDMQLSIADDDVLVSVVAVKDAVESPATNGIIRLNLSAAAPKNLTIPLDFANGLPDPHAVAGTDYVALPTSVVIPQGSSGIDIDVVPISIEDSQGSRSLSVSLVDTDDIVLAGSAGSTGSVAVINILDGSAVATYGTVTIAAPTTDATDSPVVATDFRIRVARSGVTNPDIVVPLIVSGAAIPGIDYVALPASVTLPELLVSLSTSAGSSFLPLVLNTSTTPVTLPAGSTLRVGSASVTIKKVVTISTTATYAELTSALVSQVTAGTSVGVNELTLAVTPILDTESEGDEILSVTLNQPGDANFVLGSPSTGVATIADTAETETTDGTTTGTDPKPGVGSGSSSGGCGLGGGSALILGGLGLGFALRRRRD